MSKAKASEIDEHIGKRLKLKREEMGLSSVKAAELIGATPQQYSRYELGRNKMSAAQLFHIALNFNIHISWFFMGLEVQPLNPIEGKPSYRAALDKEELEVFGRVWPSLSEEQKAIIMRILDSYLQK